MTGRYFGAAVGVLVALCVGYTVVFGQWPGESLPSGGDADGWPSVSELPKGKYVPPNAEEFVCTFDYLNPAQALSRLEMGSHGKPMCPSGPSNYGSYFSDDKREALEKLIQEAGVRQDRIITMEKAGFQNAAAVLCQDYDGEIKQLVIWDPHFLGELDRKAGTKWASVAVLAHELAHHLNNDTGQQPGLIPPHKRKEQELYADRYAGQKLRAFGASKEDAVAVFHHMGEGGETHPPSRQRVALAGEGWEAGASMDAGTTRRGLGGSPSQRGGTPSPGGGTYPPTPPPMAMTCQTNFGVCPMMTLMPRGANCACYSAYGQIPGIAR